MDSCALLIWPAISYSVTTQIERKIVGGGEVRRAISVDELHCVCGCIGNAKLKTLGIVSALSWTKMVFIKMRLGDVLCSMDC